MHRLERLAWAGLSAKASKCILFAISALVWAKPRLGRENDNRISTVDETPTLASYFQSRAEGAPPPPRLSFARGALRAGGQWAACDFSRCGWDHGLARDGVWKPERCNEACAGCGLGAADNEVVNGVVPLGDGAAQTHIQVGGTTARSRGGWRWLRRCRRCSAMASGRTPQRRSRRRNATAATQPQNVGVKPPLVPGISVG